jgi:hypothetical protein
MALLDLTGRMIEVTLIDRDLKSLLGLDPKFPLRENGIYSVYGQVLGEAPVGFWLEVRLVGKPKPPGGEQRFDPGEAVLLVQWPWVITAQLDQRAPDSSAPTVRRPIGFEVPQLREERGTAVASDAEKRAVQNLPDEGGEAS